MSKPDLIIIAGCNGAGKSTYSSILVDNLVPFDFDKRFNYHYNKLIESEYRDVMANNLTIQEFESEIQNAFDNNQSFCYETNFISHPIYWVQKAKEIGYNLKIIFFCLETIEIAMRRVWYRTKLNGHFVEESVIRDRWKVGYKNINLYYNYFDYLLFIDNSFEDKIPTFLFELKKVCENEYEFRKFINILPDYTQRRIPSIFGIITTE